MLFENMSSQNTVKGFKGSDLPTQTESSRNKLTLCSTYNVVASTSQKSEETSNDTQMLPSMCAITSPFKDLKQAILSAMSPNQSYLTKEGMIISKCQWKRIQAKAGEMLTHEDILQRLKND